MLLKNVLWSQLGGRWCWDFWKTTYINDSQYFRGPVVKLRLVLLLSRHKPSFCFECKPKNIGYPCEAELSMCIFMSNFSMSDSKISALIQTLATSTTLTWGGVGVWKWNTAAERWSCIEKRHSMEGSGEYFRFYPLRYQIDFVEGRSSVIKSV